MKSPVTFDLDEIEFALVDAATAQSSAYHRLGYAWEALKRCGHQPSREKEFEAAREKMIS
jgi:hypothetical protein